MNSRFFVILLFFCGVGIPYLSQAEEAPVYSLKNFIETITKSDERKSEPEKIDEFFEGETARFILESFLSGQFLSNPLGSNDTQANPNPWLESLRNELFPHLKRIRITGTQSDLKIQILFFMSSRIRFKNPKTVKNAEFYGLEIPLFIRYRIRQNDSVFMLETVGDPRNSVIFKFKLPVIKDEVFFHQIWVDFLTGDGGVKVGVVENSFYLYGSFNVFSKKWNGIEFFKSFFANSLR